MGDDGPVLEITAEQVGDLGVLRLQGEVDHATAPFLHQRAESMLGDGSRSLVLDLTEVTFLDSSGINAIVRARNQAHAQGGTVTVRHASTIVRRVMDITGLGPLLVPAPEDHATV
jgi:anti-anti-sigma factor